MADQLKERIERKSEARKELLKKRATRCKCKYCGGELELRQVMFTSLDDAKIDIFCKKCDRLEFGVEPEIYKNAEFFVEETEFNCFPELDDSIRTRQMSIAKVSEIMTWFAENLGIVDMNGFLTEIKATNPMLGECVTLSEKEITELRKVDRE